SGGCLRRRRGLSRLLTSASGGWCLRQGCCRNTQQNTKDEGKGTHALSPVFRKSKTGAVNWRASYLDLLPHAMTLKREYLPPGGNRFSPSARPVYSGPLWPSDRNRLY